MSLPSRSKSSLARSASLIPQLALYNLGCAFIVTLASRLKVVLLTPRDVLEIARLPGVFGHLRRSIRCSDSANSTCVSLTSARLTTPGSATSSGFPSPSTLHSASASPTLFRVGVAPGLPFSFEGFSPFVAPGASRLAVSSVSSSPSNSLRSSLSIGFEDVSIERMRCRRRACLVRDAARSFLGCCPLRGFDLLGLAPRFRGAPLLGFSGSSIPPCDGSTLTSCSSEFQRTKKSTRLSLRLPP